MPTVRPVSLGSTIALEKSMTGLESSAMTSQLPTATEQRGAYRLGAPRLAIRTSLVIRRRAQAVPQWMCSASSGTTTQPCLRSSQTENVGGGKAGSAKAPTGIAISSSEASLV